LDEGKGVRGKGIDRGILMQGQEEKGRE